MPQIIRAAVDRLGDAGRLCGRERSRISQATMSSGVSRYSTASHGVVLAMALRPRVAGASWARWNCWLRPMGALAPRCDRAVAGR